MFITMFSLRKTLASTSFLLLVLSFDQVAADCADSLICCGEINEILLIAAVVALCVFFLIQCIVILFLSWRIRTFQQRFDEYDLRRGAMTYYNVYEMSSKNDVKEERESDTMTSGRGSVSRFDSGSTKRSSQPVHPIPMRQDRSDDDKGVWSIY